MGEESSSTPPLGVSSSLRSSSAASSNRYSLSEASRSALDAPSDTSLRVPYYCEENVWRLAFRKLNKLNEDQGVVEQKEEGEGSKQDRCNGTKAFTTKCKSNYFVVFISNPKECVPLFYQRASGHPLQPVFWDYHVILIEETEKSDNHYQEKNDNDTQQEKSPLEEESRSNTTEAFVLDMDSYLPFRCPLEQYLMETFPFSFESLCTSSSMSRLSSKQYAPLFRIIDASVYLKYFSSDRMHMFDTKTKQWNAPPPPYDCILPSRSKSSNNDCVENNLDNYRKMKSINNVSEEKTTNANPNPTYGKESITNSKYGSVVTVSELKFFFD